MRRWRASTSWRLSSRPIWTSPESVLDDLGSAPAEVMNDEHCLALLKHYRSLMPLAMEAHKPMFQLRPADGAIGAHVAAVQACYEDFENLALKIASSIGIEIQQ